MRRLRRLVLATCWLGSAALLAGCTAPGDLGERPGAATASGSPSGRAAAVETLAGWSRVALPGDFQPGTLAVDGGALWIGGVAAGVRQPRLAVATNPGSGARALPRLVRLDPVSPYAQNAEIVSLAVRGGRVAALGGVRDGAHSNVRWSVWLGTERGLQEYPQGFNTFGGQQAGDLVGIVPTSTGPVIVGTWSSSHGLDAAAWLPVDRRWIRQPSAGTVLASTDRNQVSPRDAIGSGDEVLAVGSVLELGPDLRQRPAVWRWPSRRAAWADTLLPSTGPRGEALAATCSTSGCTVFGHADDSVAGWRLGGGETAQLPDLPAAPLLTNPGASAFAVRAAAGDRAGLAFTSEANQGRLLLDTGSGWRLFATPPGLAGRRAVVVGRRLYLVVQADGRRALWTVDLSTVG